VNGSSSADTIAVSGTTVAITNRHRVNYTGVQALTVNGRAGSDTFNVTPSATTAIFIDGGDPIGTRPGDLLNIIAGRRHVTFFAGPQTDEGSFVVDADQPVSFDDIESLRINGKPLPESAHSIGPRPSIIHSTKTQDPDAGIVDLDYGTARFVVQYDDIEQAVISKG
jgi:hypothetical protein